MKLNKVEQKLYLINPRGFCAGVKRAINIVEEAINDHKKPVFVYHEIVHNANVLKYFKDRGVVFARSLRPVKDNSSVIFSAHGVHPKIRKEALKKNLKIIDATCPLVAKVHNEAVNYHKQGYKILLIGKHTHQEIKGIRGEAPMQIIENINDIKKVKYGKKDKIIVLTQTTFIKEKRDLIFNKLKKIYKNIELPKTEDICAATRARQDAILKFSKKFEKILVIGSKSSNNARRLVDIGISSGIESQLISGLTELNKKCLIGYNSIGITASASTPESSVLKFINKIKRYFPDLNIEEIGKKE